MTISTGEIDIAAVIGAVICVTVALVESGELSIESRIRDLCGMSLGGCQAQRQVRQPTRIMQTRQEEEIGTLGKDISTQVISVQGQAHRVTAFRSLPRVPLLVKLDHFLLSCAPI